MSEAFKPSCISSEGLVPFPRGCSLGGPRLLWERVFCQTVGLGFCFHPSPPSFFFFAAGKEDFSELRKFPQAEDASVCTPCSEFLFSFQASFGNFSFFCKRLMLWQIYLHLCIEDRQLKLSCLRSAVRITQSSLIRSPSYLSKQKIWPHVSSVKKY